VTARSLYIDVGALAETGPPHLTILHHTDCGIKQLAAFPGQLAEFFEIPVADLDTKEINDPQAAVRVDVEIARRSLPSGRVISGLVYDTETTHRGCRSARPA
jgi:carbonic anhydrase